MVTSVPMHLHLSGCQVLDLVPETALMIIQPAAVLALLSFMTTFMPAALAGVFTAVVVGGVLGFLTPVFRFMPLNALAAVVISGVLGLFEWDECLFLYKVSCENSGQVCTPLASLLPGRKATRVCLACT